ncbi:MAG: ThuA domain-containing protein [Flavobacteriaceae bacterium]
MKRIEFSFTVCLVFSCLLLQCQPQSDEEPQIIDDQELAQLLVFTKTAGFRHQSIEKGVTTLMNLGSQYNFEITQTEDATVFSSDGLSAYDLVVFLSTTRNILNTEQEQAFKTYINNGGSFMGIHAATDTEYNWPWYGELVGAYFESHPNNPNVRDAVLKVMDNSHGSTAHLNDPWLRSDEWYNFRNINPDINVLITLDETSYEGGTNGDFHPIAWYHEFDGGRVFYTGGGHTEASFDEPDFQQHLLGGIAYCLGR